MKKYTIIITKTAQADMRKFHNFICKVYKQKATAKHYRNGILRTARKLAGYAGSLGRNEYVQKKFGMEARHITYKKMAIIYVIKDDVVYVRRIIPSSLII